MARGKEKASSDPTKTEEEVAKGGADPPPDAPPPPAEPAPPASDKEDKKEPPSGALEVVDRPTIPEDAFDPSKGAETAAPGVKSLSIFNPTVKVVVRDITEPVKLHNQCGFIMFSAHGLESFASDIPFDTKKSKWAMRFRNLSLKYQSMGTVRTMKHVDGYADTSLHSYVLDSEVAAVGSDIHKIVLKERKIHGENLTPAHALVRHQIRTGLQPTTILTDLTAAGEDEDSTSIIDLSVRLRAIGSRVIVQDVLANPERIRLLMHGLDLYSYMFMDYATWRAVHQAAGILSPVHGAYIRDAHNIFDRDVLSVRHHKQHMYGRLFFGGANSSDNWYFNILPDEPWAVSQGALNRSYTLAKVAVDHISTSERESFSNVGRAGAEFMAKLGTISSSYGSDVARVLSAGLLGGYRRAFEISPAPVEMSPAIASLCAYANLVFMDFDSMTPQTQSDTLITILLPFYAEYSQRSVTVNPATGFLLPGVAVGIDTIVKDFLDARALNAAHQFTLVTPPQKFVNTTAAGARVATNLIIMMNVAIRNAMLRRFFPFQITNRVIMSQRDQIMFPFPVHADCFDAILHGDRRYSSQAHAQEAGACAGMIIAWSKILSEFAENRGMNLAVQSYLDAKIHLRGSMAVVTAAMIAGSQNRELMPYEYLAREPVEYMTMPFQGWLSFALHGISSALVETDDHFVKYSDKMVVKMPSLYPMYTAFERCIVEEVVNAIRGVPAHAEDLEVKRKEVVELIQVIMRRYWTTLDSDSTTRITTLLDMADTQVSHPGFPTIPLYAAAPLVLDQVFKAVRLTTPRGPGQPQMPYGGVALPTYGAFIYQPGAAIPPANNFSPAPEGAYITQENAKNKLVTTFYISKAPITPVIATQVNKNSVFLYTVEEADILGATVLSLQVLINHRYTGATQWSVEELRALADVYFADTGVDWEYISVENVVTSFKFVEETSRSDTLKRENLTIKIKRDVEQYRDDKFDVSELEVCVHNVGELTQLAGMNIANEANKMRPLVRYVVVPWETILPALAHFDAADVDLPTLYNYEKRGVGPAELDKWALSKIRLRDGFHGATYTARCRFTTREIEELPLATELVRRPAPGAV